MESVQIRRPQNRPETRRTTKAAGEEKLRVAAYCRVSTDSDEQETSFETQVEVYEKKIRANPAWEYAGVYTDEGITGTKASKRPGFQKMIKLIGFSRSRSAGLPGTPLTASLTYGI